MFMWPLLTNAWSSLLILILKSFWPGIWAHKGQVRFKNGSKRRGQTTAFLITKCPTHLHNIICNFNYSRQVLFWVPLNTRMRVVKQCSNLVQIAPVYNRQIPKSITHQFSKNFFIQGLGYTFHVIWSTLPQPCMKVTLIGMWTWGAGSTWAPWSPHFCWLPL